MTQNDKPQETTVPECPEGRIYEIPIAPSADSRKLNKYASDCKCVDS